MPKQYCVIGDPIEHSLSPYIYNKLFSMYGISGCVYGKKQVTQDTLRDFLISLNWNNIKGFNITMPLKQAVLQYLKYADPSARYGANTVVVKEDGLYGYSTDAVGFRKSLALHDKEYENSNIVFLGCGGAARALIGDCLEHKPSSITILNRTLAKAAEFEGEPGVHVNTLDSVGEYMSDCDILVNATPLGMHGVAAHFEDLSFLEKLPKAALVADLIYKPRKTMLLKEAEKTGHEIMNGLWMLVWQALYAFEKYTQIEPEVEAFYALEALLSKALSS